MQCLERWANGPAILMLRMRERLRLIKSFAATIALFVFLNFASTLLAFQEPPIRVALMVEVNSASVSGAGGMELRELRNGVLIDVIDAGKSVSFSRKGDEVKSSTGHKRPAFTLYPVEGFLEVDGKQYRGTIRIVPDSGGITVVNALPIEEYLRGVVPREIPCSWHMEVLKAQAVAARTYAVNRMGQFPDRSFDVYGTVADQAYGGVNCETERSDEAVKATRGLVMTHEGEPIIAYYSASAGGCTTDPVDSKGYELPYLRSVISPDEESHRWTIEVPSSELARVCKNAGHNIGVPKTIRILDYAPSGNVRTVEVKGSKGTAVIRATELRRLLGYGRMKSTRFGFGDESMIPPITVAPGDGAGGKMVREVLSKVLLKLGSGYYPVLSGDGIVDTKIGLAVVIGAAGKSYLGSESYAVGYEFTSAEYPAQPEPFETVTDSHECLEPFAVGNGVTFVGTGYGHGMGMSQHGAKALAESGWDFRKILQHYYYHIDLTVMYE